MSVQWQWRGLVQTPVKYLLVFRLNAKDGRYRTHNGFEDAVIPLILRLMKSLKRTLVVILFCITVTGLRAQSLSVIVGNIRNSKGYIRVAIYDSKDKFMKQQVATGEVRAVAGQVIIKIANLHDGDYALSVMHDSNNNEKLDTNLIGLPREGFAFSNDAMGTVGPPNFKEASFRIEGPTTHAVKLRYY